MCRGRGVVGYHGVGRVAGCRNWNPVEPVD